MKPIRKIIFNSNELSEILDRGTPLEEVLSLFYKLLEKNYALKTPGTFERISHSSIEKDLAESIIGEIVNYLKESDKVSVIRITPVVKGEIFAIELLEEDYDQE